MIRSMLATASFAVLMSLPVTAQSVGDRAGTSRAKGNAEARVVVLEIADFQCPYCARFAVDVFPRIDSAYVKTGKVQWVFVNMPLPNHGNAWLASEAALCAGGTGNGFWPMHDRLFDAQAEWSPSPQPGPLFRRYAQQAGASLEAYDACVAGDQVAALILQDFMFGLSRGVNGTPAFLVGNDQTVIGYKSFEEWQLVLDAAVKKAAGRE